MLTDYGDYKEDSALYLSEKSLPISIREHIWINIRNMRVL